MSSNQPPTLVVEAMDSVRQSNLFPLLFSAWFTERVYREEIADYRDRLQVDKEEVKVVKSVRIAARKIKKAITAAELRNKSAGIEKFGEGGVAFYVDLSTFAAGDSASSSRTTVPFGHYWFLVEDARWGSKGVEWKIRVVREVFQGDRASSDKCPHCGKYPDGDASSVSTTGVTDDPLNLSEIAQRLQRGFREHIRPEEWLHEIRPCVTVNNAVNAVKFILVLAMAAVSGLAKLLPKLLDLFNRTIRESAHLIRMATPFLLACVEMMNKAVGGFYLLLAMIWRDFRKPQEPGPGTANRRYIKGPPPEYPYARSQVQRPYLKHR